MGSLLGGAGFPLEEQGYSQTEMELPFFKVKDLASPLRLTETGNHISMETAEKLGATIFPKGAIVFAKVGAALLLNRFRILGANGCIDNNMMAFQLHGHDDVLFLRYALETADLSCNYNQGPVPSVNTRQVGALTVPVPPVIEQKRITAYLNASCAAIDAAVKSKREQIGALGGVRKSLLQRIVTRGLKPEAGYLETGNLWLEQIPTGWSLVKLKRLAEIQGGLTLGKTYEGVATIEYPYLRVANVQDGHVNLNEFSTLDVPPAVAAGVTLQTGDVLMTEGGDLDKLGRGTVWEGQIAPCLHQNHVFAVRCLPHKLLPHFLAYVTASRYGRDYFEATGKRTTNLAATNATKVGAFYIPLPPLDVQQELIDYLDVELGRLKGIQDIIVRQIDTLTAYRKSLIHECVTGQRRITDADLAKVEAHG
jgi:type I restriction enzyme S subunit